MRRGYQIGAVVALLTLLLTGCQTSASESPATSAARGASAGDEASRPPGGGTSINVTLQEWAVLPDADSAPAGDVTFVVTNDGPDDVHEFVIIRTDLDPGSLPTDATGAVDEAGADIEVIDEIKDIAVRGTAEVTATLEAGNYILICNIYTESEDEAHYAMGMRVAFTVE
ncbi:MAG: hypothetical protein ACRDFZ_04450 [Candidatus Limnocylindria bacterium]